MEISLTFLSDLSLYETEKPFELWLPPEQIPKELPTTNCVFESRDNIPLVDIRSGAIDHSLETTGFTIFSDPLVEDLSESDVGDYFKIEQYLETTARRVKKECNASKVICYDWRYRTTEEPKTNGFEGDDADRKKPLKPALNVHVDDSYEGGLLRVRQLLTDEELDDFTQNRASIRFINVWRPLISQVEDMPLAFCDRRTVSNGDLIECDKIHPDHVELGDFVKYNSAQKWYWCSSQRKEESFMFVTWDSRARHTNAGVCHAAFRNPSAKPGHPPRSSIEVRLMVLNMVK